MPFLLESKLFDLNNDKSIAQNAIASHIGDCDRLVDKLLQLKEQLGIYKECKVELQKAKICTIREFKEVSLCISHTLIEIENERTNLKMSEDAVKDLKQNLKNIEEQITHLEAELNTYGQLYRFPNDDRRSAVID